MPRVLDGPQSQCHHNQLTLLDQALEHYNAACKEGGSAAAFNNRAMAHLKLAHYDAAEADCCHVLQLEPRNCKALLRRAAARSALRAGHYMSHEYASSLGDQQQGMMSWALCNHVHDPRHNASCAVVHQHPVVTWPT